MNRSGLPTWGARDVLFVGAFVLAVAITIGSVAAACCAPCDVYRGVPTKDVPLRCTNLQAPR